MSSKPTHVVQLARRYAPLLAAIALGVGAALAGWFYLRSSEREFAENFRKANAGVMVPVVVAQSSLPGGSIVGADVVAVRQIPESYLNSGAVRPHEFDRYDGRRLIVSVQPGEPLLASYFRADERRIFSEQIEPGVRAITVPVDQISSISGMLRAGDRIDFLFVGATERGNDEQVVVPLLQDVLVRATGTITAEEFAARRNRPGASVEQDPYASQRYTTVTVAVTPEDAQKLILSQRMGQLIAALRNPEDRDVSARGVGMSDIHADVARAAGLGAARSPGTGKGSGGTGAVHVANASGTSVEYIYGIGGGAGPTSSQGNVSGDPVTAGLESYLRTLTEDAGAAKGKGTASR